MDPEIAYNGFPEEFFLLSAVVERKTPTRRFLQGRTFEPLSDEYVLGTLQETVRLFEKEIAPAINRTARKLHQRLAKGSKIQATHSQWAIEQEVLLASIVAAKSKAKACYKHIPYLSDSQKVADAIYCKLYLKALTPKLEQQCTTLHHILASKHHQEALIFYKTQVKACEKLGKTASQQDASLALTKIFQETKQQLKTVQDIKDQTIAAAVNTIYQEVLLYCQYAARSLQASSLYTSITKKLPPHLKTILDGDDLGEVTDSQNDPTAPPENMFRGQMIGANRLYAHVWPQAVKLEGIARSCHKLHTTLQERIKQLLSSNQSTAIGFAQEGNELEHYETSIKTLETHAFSQLRSLAKLTLATSGHAGWYYVADVLAQLQEAKIALKQLKELSDNTYDFCFQALGKCVRYLEFGYNSRESDFVWIEPVYRLWEAIKANDNLNEKPIPQFKHIFKLVINTITEIGPRTLAHSNPEALVPDAIFAKHAFTDETIEELECYLVKTLIRLTRFSDSLLDYEFEIVLHILMNDPKYAQTWKLLLEQSKALAELHTVYIKKSTITQKWIELELIKHSLFALSKAAKSTDNISAYLFYAEARQMLEDLKCHKTPNIKENLIWLDQKLSAFARNHEDKLNIDPPALRFMLSPLTTRLFSSNPESTQSAESVIIEAIHDKQFTLPDLADIIGRLVRRWVLEGFVDNSRELDAVQKGILYSLFIEYLSDAKAQEFWLAETSLVYMECALYKYRDTAKEMIEQTRTLEHYSLWT